MQFTIRYPNGNWTWWQFTRITALTQEQHGPFSSDDWGFRYDCWLKGPVAIQRLRLCQQDGQGEVSERPCGHCGRIMGDQAGGWASYNGVPVCHPNEEGRPDCYVNVSLYHHEVEDCPQCTEGSMKTPEDNGYWVGDTFVFDPPTQIQDEATGDVRTIREIDFTGMVLEDGITREDVVHAMLNPVRVTSAPPEEPDARV